MLLVHGGEKVQKVLAPFLGSKSAGDFLFDLGHANGLFGDVVGERNVVIGSEAPDIVGIGT